MEAVFIRAPYIERAGANVQVMAVVKHKIVIARQDKILVTAFHPELTGMSEFTGILFPWIEE